MAQTTRIGMTLTPQEYSDLKWAVMEARELLKTRTSGSGNDLKSLKALQIRLADLAERM